VARMRQAVSDEICARLPGARIRPLDVEPAIGAVRLAIRAAAGEPVTPSYVQEPW